MPIDSTRGFRRWLIAKHSSFVLTVRQPPRFTVNDVVALATD
jgi:hypothetical protein